MNQQLERVSIKQNGAEIINSLNKTLKTVKLKRVWAQEMTRIYQYFQ